MTYLSLQTLLFQRVARQMIHRRTEGLDQFEGSRGSRGSDHREPAASENLVDDFGRRRQTAQIYSCRMERNFDRTAFSRTF